MFCMHSTGRTLAIKAQVTANVEQFAYLENLQASFLRISKSKRYWTWKSKRYWKQMPQTFLSCAKQDLYRKRLYTEERLVSKQASLVVTRSHRVTIYRVERMQATAAGTLRVGDHVSCSTAVYRYQRNELGNTQDSTRFFCITWSNALSQQTGSTIQVAENFQSTPHVDGNKLGPSIIVALGDYRGGISLTWMVKWS